MKKSKLLSAFLSVMMICPSMAVVPSVSVSAARNFVASEHTFGVIGGFNSWSGDVFMTDADGDGIYEAEIDVAGSYEFKVRADGAWDYSWGMYEEVYDRTQNSQTNCKATVADGQKLIVKLDTTIVSPATMNNAESYVNDADFDFAADGYEYWPVIYYIQGGPLSNTSTISMNNAYTGDTITVNCISEGGGGTKQYLVLYQEPDSTNWKTLSSYSTKETIEFKPKKEGTYTIRVRVKDESGKTVAVDMPLTVTAAPLPLRNKSDLSSDSVELGKSITINCESEDGVGTKQYLVLYQEPDSTNWKTLSSYSTKETVEFKPKKEGTYTIRVRVKDENGKTAASDFTVSAVATKYTPASSFRYSINDDGTVQIMGFIGSETEVIIPSKIDGKKVTSIGNSAFYDCSDLTAVTIADSVTSIANYAFSCCTSLTSVTIPDSVTSIGDNAFRLCTSLTFITIPDSVTSIGAEVFYNCTSLTSVTIPNSVTSIGGRMFFKCTGLTSIMIPNNVTSIGISAFESCKSLTSITIPDSVTIIGPCAFYGCNNLTSVTIPDSVTSIGNLAFEGCKSLADEKGFVIVKDVLYDYYGEDASITIPNSVTSIDIGAFQYCYSLTSVAIPESVTSIGYGAFFGCTSLTIYGKAGSYAETYAKDCRIPFKELLSNESTLSADSVVLGESVTVNCKASGGETDYSYAVFYRKAGTTKWMTAQGYKTNATVKITPETAVNYEIRVAVKDASGKIERKDMNFAVKKPLTNTSKLNADTIKLGEKVKVRCFAEGGTQPYQYAVYYKKATSEKWMKLMGYGESNIIMLKPAAAVKYDVKVYVKDSSNKTVTKTLSLTVTK